MTDTFNPGPGWRELEIDAFLTVDIGPVLTLAQFEGPVKRWVREAPTPQLPTAPYTVIRVTWSPSYGRTEPSVLVKQDEQGWYGDGYAGVPEVLHRDITSFEVLSEPRAVTAKAVTDALRDVSASRGWDNGIDHLDRVAREFGVQS